MIEFLIGVFSVLGVRAKKIVKTLGEKQDIPASALEHCRRVSERTKGVINLINNRKDILQQLKEGLETKQVTSLQQVSEKITFLTLLQLFANSASDVPQ